MILKILFVIVFIEYSGISSYFPVLNVTIFLPLGLLFYTAFYRSNNYKNIFKNKTTRLISAYMTLCFISILTAVVTLYSFNFFKAVIGYFILFLLLANEMKNFKHVRTFIYIILISHIFVSVMNPESILNPSVRSYLRHPSFLGDGNDFAWSVCIAIPLAIFLIRQESKKYLKYINAFILVYLLLLIIATGSRGAFLAVSASVIYYIYKRNFNIKIIAAIVLVSSVAYVYAPSTYVQRIETIKDYESDESANARIIAWKSSLKMALDNPIFGVGTDNFAVIFGSEYSPEDYHGPWMNAHSIYFKTLGELGFPGILVFLMIIRSNFKNNKSRKIDTKARLMRQNIYDDGPQNKENVNEFKICLNMAVIAFLVGGAFLSGVKYPHLYVLSALSVSANEWTNRDAEYEE